MEYIIFFKASRNLYETHNVTLYLQFPQYFFLVS